jgi:hypothetical protein
MSARRFIWRIPVLSQGLKLSNYKPGCRVSTLHLMYLWNWYHQWLPEIEFNQMIAFFSFLFQDDSLFCCWKADRDLKITRISRSSENDHLQIYSLGFIPTFILVKSWVIAELIFFKSMKRQEFSIIVSMNKRPSSVCFWETGASDMSNKNCSLSNAGDNIWLFVWHASYEPVPFKRLFLLMFGQFYISITSSLRDHRYKHQRWELPVYLDSTMHWPYMRSSSGWKGMVSHCPCSSLK